MDAPTTPMPSVTVDLNADAGESFGRWEVVDESQLFPFLSSVNLFNVMRQVSIYGLLAIGITAALGPGSVNAVIALAASLIRWRGTRRPCVRCRRGAAPRR